MIEIRRTAQCYASEKRLCHLRTFGAGGKRNVFAISTKGKVVFRGDGVIR
jgi:hypothetical protein